METLQYEQLGTMKPIEEKMFWSALERKLADDDGSAAKEHLAAGRFITYRDPKHGNSLVREWPNGSRELVNADLDGNLTVLKAL